MTSHQDPVTPAEAPAVTADLRLKALTTLCGTGSCPTVYRTDRATVVVQGYVLTGDDAGLEMPDGERLVEIPTQILLAAADEIRRQAGERLRLQDPLHRRPGAPGQPQVAVDEFTRVTAAEQ